MTDTPAPPRVLVLDDDEGILRLEGTSLRRAGYDVFTALSTEEAFALVQARSPDLIVTDYRLAGPTTGLDLLRELRRSGNDVPVILVTAFSDEQRILEALRAGVGDVIPKTAGFLDYLPHAVSTALSRRRAEREAADAWRRRESERYFQTLAESLPQLVWTATPNGRVDYCNTRYREFAGIRTNPSGDWEWAPAIHPDDRPATMQAWTEAVRAGTVFEVEHRIRRIDGECRWHVSRAVPFKDAAGRIVRWYGTATDVHDVKVAEERLRLATQAARMFAFESDPRTGEVVRSPECLEILGNEVGVQEPFARYLERVHPGDRVPLQAAISALRPEAPAYQSTYRVVRSDGGMVFLDETARAAFDAAGRLARIVGMAADVSARHDAERRLNETTAILQAIANTTPDLIYVKDRAGRLVFANPGTLRAIGKPAGDVLGRTHRDLGVASGEADAVMANDERVMSSGASESVEETLSSAAGRRVYLATKSPLRDDTGTVIGLVGIASDVTNRVGAEEERRELLAREQAARAEAERANMLKDEFLGILSHELRTPLNAILGWAHILSTRALPDEEQVMTILGTIARNARMQARLVEDLLDMSRIASGTLRMEFHAVQVPAVVHAALESIAPTADAKRIRLTFRHEPSDRLVMQGDPARLQQVVWNLLSNAVKFTPTEGVVDVHLFSEGAAVVLQVADSGPGVPPEFLPYLFERFRQADATPTRMHGGLGLGLSIVRHLVEMHGGTVTADSGAPQGGARFTVVLPAAAGAAPGLESHSFPELTGAIPRLGGDLRGLRVLAVDDEPDTRDLVARILEDYGATVDTASCVEAALARFDEATFDVLVVDIAMPGRDGYELIRAVREGSDAAKRGVPAVALTAHVNPEDRRSTLAAGFTLHAGKPIEPSQLAYAVAVAAGRGDVSSAQPG